MYAAVETKDDFYNALGAKIKGATFYICEEGGIEKDEETQKEVLTGDIAKLPTEKIGIGSRALVIPTGEIFMLGPSRKWIKYAGVSIMN